MKTAILLGAGSSLPAGFPSTKRLTRLVLSGNGVERVGDGSYRLADGAAPATGIVRLVNCVARRLHAEAERYFNGRCDGPANYEHLFYLAQQALDEEDGNMENPAIRPFVDRLKAELSPLIESANAENESSVDFGSLLKETCNYIADIVSVSLRREPKCTDHLKIFAEACDCGHIVGISTLCHDAHVERFFTKRGKPLADGFADEEAGVRYWNGDFSSRGRVPLLKLHGSVDWFRLTPCDSEPFFNERIGIPLTAYPYHTRTVDGILQNPDDGRPMLLVGTFNKISDYSQGIFRDLHHEFRSMLRKADQLVVCGYGFGDKGINSEVIDWYYANCGRRFVVIHPDRQELVSRARGAIEKHWNEWKHRDSLTFLEKRLEDVGVGEFMWLVCGGSLRAWRRQRIKRIKATHAD